MKLTSPAPHDAALYFAYGSNMEPVQMRRRCPGSAALGPARVRGYGLCFPVTSSGDWAGGVASIEPAADAVVEGVLYRVTDTDLASLDRYEAVAEGMYARGPAEAVTFDGETHDAVTYFADPAFNAASPPSRRYLSALLIGASYHGLSAGYIAKLRSTPTCD